MSDLMLCRWCGEPIEIQDGGQWGHKVINPIFGGMRFWCEVGAPKPLQVEPRSDQQ